MASYQGFDASSYIEHYGVLGMKWGVRKDPQRAYSKSMRKLDKLDKKAEKKRFTAEKYKAKSDKRSYQAMITANESRHRKLAMKSRKLLADSSKANFKAAKYERKARKWVQAMNKNFADVKISEFTAEEVSLGKRYSVELFERMK